MAIPILALIAAAGLLITVPLRHFSSPLVLLAAFPLIALLGLHTLDKPGTFRLGEVARLSVNVPQSVMCAFPSTPEGTQVFRRISSNILTISMPFWRGGFLPIGARATVVRTTSGKLAVFSPVTLTNQVKSEIEQFGGKIDYLIAPDIEHHMRLTEWVDNYKPSVVVGPQGLPEKRKAAGLPDIHNWVVFKKDTKLEQKIDPDFDKDFDYEFVESHINKEIVFNFRPERTMIQADLLFNLPATEQFSKAPPPSLFGRFFNTIGTSTGSGHKTLSSYLFSRADPESFRSSMNRIYKWDFDAIIPCHGDSILSSGKEIFKDTMAAHLDEAAADSKASPNL